MTPESETERTRSRYDRIARYYDRMEVFAERRFAPWRRGLWDEVAGPSVLEVGVGTGKNIPYYPLGAEVTAIDLSPRMLAFARSRAAEQAVSVDLREGDAEALPFLDGVFDDAVATFVFCSVPDPLRGLAELRRVLRPGGRLHLIEHVRASGRVAGALMDALNPLAVRFTGANFNRNTVENVERAGFTLEQVTALGMRGLVKRIVARAGAVPPGGTTIGLSTTAKGSGS